MGGRVVVENSANPRPQNQRVRTLSVGDGELRSLRGLPKHVSLFFKAYQLVTGLGW